MYMYMAALDQGILDPKARPMTPLNVNFLYYCTVQCTCIIKCICKTLHYDYCTLKGVVLPNLHSCFYNCMETQNVFYYFRMFSLLTNVFRNKFCLVELTQFTI